MNEVITMSFYPKGGLGDYIVSLKVLDYLMSLAPCKVDVYCEHLEFGKSIFGQRSNVNIYEVLNAVEYNKYWKTLRDYDVAIISEVFVEINHMDDQKIKIVAPVLYDFWLIHQSNYNKVRPCIDEYMYCLENYIKKCEIKERDRWTAFNDEEIEVTDKFSGVCMLDDYRAVAYRKVNCEKYITINYGADTTGLSGVQTKVWPIEYFEQLVKILKKAMPEYKLIQIGAKKNRKIQGVDKYILGESLEITKWLLKKSSLHIDSEGGLVHLGTQLGTKCLVIFGPTPAHFYAYEQNINVLPQKCGNCMGTSRNWYVNCLKKQKKPECMYSTTPEMVLNKVLEYFTTKTNKQLILHNKKPDSMFIRKKQGERIAVLGVKDKGLPIVLNSNKCSVTVFADYNEKEGDAMKLVCNQYDIDYRISSYFSYPCMDESFDMVVDNREESARIKDDICRILKQGGIYVVDNESYVNEVVKNV